MANELTGRSIIGFERGSRTAETFTAYDPRTGERIGPEFHTAAVDELNRAVELAEGARIAYAKVSGTEKAAFLRTIAGNIEALGDQLTDRASAETGLPTARFQGERSRTCSQIRLFAELVEEGSWVDARIDRAVPDREPLPKPDVRSMLRPVGPVAVFCAGNFPLAFSVAGGDTVSALAAGCPVVVNAHSAHPGTAELAASAISDAVRMCGLPEGVFSLLFSGDYLIGQALVKHPSVKAVGFTGSRRGGRALMDLAAARPEPIPVYAEMGSINPVFILPGALAERRDQIAAGLYASVNLGFGQFCTKPGVAILHSPEYQTVFAKRLAELTKQTEAAPLLTSEIRRSYRQIVEKRSKTVDLNAGEGDTNGFAVNSSVFVTSASNFIRDPELSDEIFGPSTLLVQTAGRGELIEIARRLEGQLTATVHGTDEDLADFSELIGILETKVGRIVFNGFPTGVEVCQAMVHGGAYPATSDSKSTSVGTRAIERFARPVCFQDFPEVALPDELKDGNPRGIRRLVDGRLSVEN